MMSTVVDLLVGRWRRSAVLLVGGAVLVAGCSRLGGCSRAPEPSVTDAQSPVPEVVDPATNYDLNALLAVADPEQGRVLFTACSACHSLEPGVRGSNGPNLYGVFGRRAGRGAYQYSDAFRMADFTWSAEPLDRWLRNPREFIQGSRMVFMAIDRPQDRANLISYVMQQTDAPTVAGVPVLSNPSAPAVPVSTQ